MRATPAFCANETPACCRIGARCVPSGLFALAPPSDPRCRDASCCTVYVAEIMRFRGAPGQAHISVRFLNEATRPGTIAVRRTLAAAASRRLNSLLDLPTVSEVGVPGFGMFNWYGVL